MKLLLVVAVLLCSAPWSVLPPAAASARHESRAELAGALVLLHAWDARRARAWSRSDTTALRALYARGSSAGRADVRLLRDYDGAGLVVRRLVTQVLEARVLDADAFSLTLRIVDRVAGGVVRSGARVRPLGATRPAVREVELRHVAGSWVVDSVTASGSDPPAARPPRRGR